MYNYRSMNRYAKYEKRISRAMNIAERFGTLEEENRQFLRVAVCSQAFRELQDLQNRVKKKEDNAHHSPKSLRRTLRTLFYKIDESNRTMLERQRVPAGIVA